jgi:hypothetical protein
MAAINKSESLGRRSFGTVSTAADTRAMQEMKRWIGLGVIADNLINIGRAMQKTESAVSACRARRDLALCASLATISRTPNFAPESN